MTRRVRRRVARRGNEKVDCLEIDENLSLDKKGVLDWIRLPDDTVIQLFSFLNYRDRASLSSTCRSWRILGKSPCLWEALDLRPHKCDTAAAASLAPRCQNLQKLRFRGLESANAIINLRARNLREVSGDCCKKMTDATLSVLAARHEALECLQIGPDFCERISSDAVKAVAICCRHLQKLRLSGIHEVYADAINALANHCPNLIEIGFIDCRKVDETALGNVGSVCFLSVAGTTNIKWNIVLQPWSKLPHLTGLDVSRTDITASTVLRLFSSFRSLKVLSALSCPALENDATFVSNNNHKGKVLLAVFTDILKGVAALSADTTEDERNVFLNWRKVKTKDRESEEIMNWLEWILSHSLLRVSEGNPPGLDNFWLNQGSTLLLSFIHSAQEEVQERAATALATFVVIDDENASIDTGRAEAVMRDGGIRLLLNLARSWREGLQSEAAKAIANLSVNANVAKAVAEEGGISILANLARSVNKLVAEEAAGGLWNLSVGEEHKVVFLLFYIFIRFPALFLKFDSSDFFQGAIAEAGGVKALVDLIFKWSGSTGGEGVLERAAGALANLAADDKCSMEVASVGGVRALVTLARNCKFEGVQEQAARALANLAAHGDSNGNNAAVGQEAGSLEALVQLIRSPHDGVRQEAAGALWNLSFDDRNREAIAGAGGVEALVALARSCSNASHGLQERAAGALWGLSVSEVNSIAIGREGGVAPLIALARSDAEDVHETAAGALWNLAFNPGNALRIVEEGGVPTLVHLCSSSVSKMARFMSALALAYMFDGRMDEIALTGTSTESTSKSVSLDGARKMALKNIEAFILTFSDPQAFSAAAASLAPTALTQVTESARIQEAGHLRCSGAEIGRFVAMLRNPSAILKACAAFALLQFTIPGGRHAQHHVGLLQNAGAPRVLRVSAAATGAPLGAKIFARIVLRNLEQHHTGSLV
ncbi:protein ARABIDILLO 1 isoform X1 [Olea europaea var. sylvestris]|uniref:protein ARABIDILLO 1 isoform X1 n=1 Tax=Olea europaea var. sylvestris TaxID=158386 RepID=UPI000C1D32B7|nr:protein ARABIDILLO 1 isoform X1 [Olea europaea var. sylvestris]XP_022863479.1 protein ARABIDILLO 1 isoform X1 [Olea europaea var. sylvestris]